MASLFSFKDVKSIRENFPALKRKQNDIPIAYFDGPGGTQVPQMVIDAVSDYYRRCNSNTHGYFETSHDTDVVIDTARKKVADFLGAESEKCISFGANMTSLAFALSRAFSRILNAGDEVLITQLDHEANRGPWLTLRRHGIKVREVALLESGKLDYDDFANKLNENTRLVCVGMASNLLGTVNDIELIRRLTYRAGALLLVDAVHYAPHFSIDVARSGVDFLLCSAYKFYGPHVGILYSKPGLLESLPTDVLRTQSQESPYRIETGTLNHAALQGVSAAIDFIASFGEGESFRERLRQAMQLISNYEYDLAKKMFQSLSAIQHVRVFGPDFSSEKRAPTLGFTIDGFRPEQICSALNDFAINAWDGHFYAIRGVEVLGLLEQGGLTRLGVSLYNTGAEVVRLIEALHKIITTADR